LPEDSAIEGIFDPEHADKRFDEDSIIRALNIFCFNPLLRFLLCEFHLFATIYSQEQQKEPSEKNQFQVRRPKIKLLATTPSQTN